MKRIWLISLMILAGCGDPHVPEKKPETIVRTVSHDVIYYKGPNILRSESDSLARFLDGVPVKAVSYAVIDAYDQSAVQKKRIAQIQHYLGVQGINPHVIYVQRDKQADHNKINLVLQYHQVVQPGPCPDWSSNPISNYSNSAFSNFGCSYRNDIAVQLQDPADYQHGNGRAMYDSQRESGLLSKYMGGGAAASGSASSSGGSSSGSSSGASAGTTPSQ